MYKSIEETTAKLKSLNFVLIFETKTANSFKSLRITLLLINKDANPVVPPPQNGSKIEGNTPSFESNIILFALNNKSWLSMFFH